MFKEDYPDDACALFLFDEPRVLSFHGRNCLFPIIVAFLYEDGGIDSIGVLEPNGAPLSSKGECVAAIELKANELNESITLCSHRIMFNEEYDRIYFF